MEEGNAPPAPQTPPAGQPAETNPAPAKPPGRPGPKLVYGLVIVIIILIAVILWLVLKPSQKTPVVSSTGTNSSISQTPPVSDRTANLPGLKLNANKNYGDKYADGILPVGDNKYSATTAKAGVPYVCQNYAHNLQSQPGGAMVRGPWFIGTTKYNANKKLHVQGSVMWQASFSNKVSGDTRTIISNDLPDHPTGVFPISPTDPAYAYDRNPNHIEGQTFTYKLSADPSYGNPSCIGGQVGVMLTGVALFSAFDAGGRDAGAWEVQDSCNGHPQSDGIYHYHTLSSCIKNTSVETVIGFALDGFPITGPQVSKDNILTTADLDECHGLTSQIVLDGKNVTMYHYVMTQDFPYSVSCYRGIAIQPPGQKAAPNQHP